MAPVSGRPAAPGVPDGAEKQGDGAPLALN